MITKSIALALVGLFYSWASNSESPAEIASRVQSRYQSLKSMKVTFAQTYEANGIRQEESGILWILKPGRMRWEYAVPERKIFLVDGKNSYFYVPAENQVSSRKLTQEDIRYTAFGFLLDQSSLEKDFQAEIIPAEGPIPKDHRALKLVPKHSLENVAYILLGLHPENLEISVIVVRELSGADNSFAFSNLEENPTLKESLFELKIPKGTEVLSLDVSP